MSRSERRAYQRLTKKQDPYAPPSATAAARARMERQRARRSATARGGAPTSLLGGRTGWVVFGGAVAAFLLGMSLAWRPDIPGVLAVLIGIGAGLAWLAVTLGFVVWRRRAAARPADGRSAGP